MDKITPAPAAHTRGPWIVRRGTIGTAQFHIAEMMPSASPDMPPGFAPADQQEANGRLIAAAPDLLAACELALGRSVGRPPAIDWSIVEAAIAKARGAA